MKIRVSRNQLTPIQSRIQHAEFTAVTFEEEKLLRYLVTAMTTPDCSIEITIRGLTFVSQLPDPGEPPTPIS